MFTIQNDEYLSTNTEINLAKVINHEMQMFEDLFQDKGRLDSLGVTPEKLIEVVEMETKESKRVSNLNYKNLKSFILKMGLIPYDQEIISFLRRVDRDDDGVINVQELDRFMRRFKSSKLNEVMERRQVSQERLLSVSPRRKIVESGVCQVLNSERKSR